MIAANDKAISFQPYTNPNKSSVGWETFDQVVVNGEVQNTKAHCTKCHNVVDIKNSRVSLLRHTTEFCNKRADEFRKNTAKHQQTKHIDRVELPAIPLDTTEKSLIKNYCTLICAVAFVPFAFFDSVIFRRFVQHIIDTTVEHGRLVAEEVSPMIYY